MSESKRQAQINTRCSCMSKPLNECDCGSEKIPEKQLNCDACNRANLSSDEIFRAYGANFCSDCFQDCVQ